jgi:hypothetical protein
MNSANGHPASRKALVANPSREEQQVSKSGERWRLNFSTNGTFLILFKKDSKML